MKLNRFTAVLLVAVIMIPAGCASNQGQQQSQPPRPSHTNNVTPVKWGEQIDQTPAGKAKLYVKNHRKEVTNVHAVNSRKELLVAVKLKTFDRLKAKSITKKIAKHLQKRNPKHKAQVSSDKKIYQQITQTESQLRQGEMKTKTLEKRMKKIDGFFKEQ